jgi:putative transposase
MSDAKGELNEQLGYEVRSPEGRGIGNLRNGFTSEKVMSAPFAMWFF